MKYNKSLNKVLKPTKKYLSMPSYAFNKQSRLTIHLPNGMELLIHSNESGEYCAVNIKSHQDVSDYTMISEKIKKEFDTFNAEDVETTYLDHETGKTMKIEFTKFNNK